MRRHHLFRGVLTFFIIFLLPAALQAFNHAPEAPSAINRHSAASPVFNYPYAVPRIKADLPPEIPTGAKVLYHGERRYERYGLVEHAFTIYELDGKTWLRREQWFSGSEETVSDKEGIARNAREVTMPLTSKQKKSIRKWLKHARFASLASDYQAEQEAYERYTKAYEDSLHHPHAQVNEQGDTVYMVLARPRQELRYHQPSSWRQTVAWAGTLQGIQTSCIFYNPPLQADTWTEGHPCRDRYLEALDRFHGQLDKMVYEYKMQHPYEGEIRSFSFRTSGGMLRHIAPDGRILRQGSNIVIREKDGQWYVFGYVGEQEDTVKVGPEVMAHVEELFRAYDDRGLHPVFADGEKVLRTEVDDGISWQAVVSFNTREGILESGTFGESYIEPKWAREAYDGQMQVFRAVNDYLWGFLSIGRDTGSLRRLK